jgi:hypothetical protein
MNDEQLTHEAQSTLTTPERLSAIYEANPRLGAFVARNPVTPIALLRDLARRFPCDVLANPVLEAECDENGQHYSQFSLKELVYLCLASSNEFRRELLMETKSRIASEIKKLKSIEESTLSCVWRGKRSIVISASDFSDFVSMSDFDAEAKSELISQAAGKYPAVYDVEYRAFIEGVGPMEFENLPDFDNPNQQGDPLDEGCLSVFLKAICSRRIDELVNDYEIIRDGNGDGELRITSLSMDGSMKALISSTFEFSHCFGSNTDPISCENGCLVIPIDACEECEREYGFELGALAELAGFQDNFTEMRLKDNWCVLLARQICSLK